MGMALTSPGVQVTVVDESFYTPAEPGTVPLIVVATAQDKQNAAGTGTAAGTLAANAGTVYRLTSQRDLLDVFGVPFFEKSASSSPIHGSERNEYGLLAAYSLLGVSNSAFVVRANVDLSELAPQSEIPGANPNDGQWWVDTQGSNWGIFEWNGAAASTTGGQKFANKVPVAVLTSDDTTKIDTIATPNRPKESVGQIGDYAVVFQSNDDATIWYKSAGLSVAGVTAGEWVLVGSNEWALSHPTVLGTSAPTSLTAGNFTINGTTVNIGSGDTIDTLVATINGLTVVDPEESRGVFAKNVGGKLYLYTNTVNDTLGDSTLSNAIVIGAGTANLTQLGISVGTYYGPALQISPHTTVPQWKDSGTGQIKRPSGSVWVKSTEPGQGARLRVSKYSLGQLSWVSYEAPMYSTPTAALYFLDRSGGGFNLPVDTVFTQTNSLEDTQTTTTSETATFKLWRRSVAGATVVTSVDVKAGTVGSTGTKTFTIGESLKNTTVLSDTIDTITGRFTGVSSPKTVSFTAVNTLVDAELMAAAINNAGFTNLVASVTNVSDTVNRLVITHKLGGDFRVIDTSGVFATLFTGQDHFYATPAGDLVYDYLVSNWEPLSVDTFITSADAPQNEPTDGQLWYNPTFAEVDVMIHNGNTWVGYRNTHSPYAEAFSNRTGWLPSVSASNPYEDGVTTDGDLWISTADLENYPTIYRYNSNLTGANSEKWELVDKTDQITESGILFADARWRDESANPAGQGSTGTGAAGELADLAVSNYLDFDAPDPALYPRGMLLWNLRRSGGNVKRYVNNYIDITADNARFDNTNSPNGNVFVSGQSQADYSRDRWVTASANNEDGSGTFGRKAQRSVVVAALKSVVDTNEQVRDEERRNFNLIAAPGYPELLSNLVNLNIDRGVTAFVVGDTPLRLAADATTLTNWGTNANLVTDNGDAGIVTYDEYAAVWYPNGFTTDLSGTSAVVPASHMMLRTIALSDNVSYPWFAPAGTRRGGITNATAVGYIDPLSGEFQTIALNEGQRDTLYDLKVNPITFFNGVGLVAYGQKTRARNASALDRINVARLVVYLRSQLNKLARPYLFEPNDKITRDEIKQACESLLLELVGLRALYDFAVVCDETNNTPSRIDRNELWVDIAIEPVKAIEFIYIPLRIKNTGEI